MGATRLSFHEERVQTTYNIASTFYRRGGYEEAQSFLAASLERARETVAQWGFFNRGNVLSNSVFYILSNLYFLWGKPFSFNNCI